MPKRCANCGAWMVDMLSGDLVSEFPVCLECGRGMDAVRSHEARRRACADCPTCNAAAEAARGA